MHTARSELQTVIAMYQNVRLKETVKTAKL